ncbi:MAG: hemin uptake protein HemP [Rhodobacteraceae bacterium]|nr:hemin uptake protein HemP [Paracoccaceae bacterium]
MNICIRPPQIQQRPARDDIPTYDARHLVGDEGVQACLVLDGLAYYLRITRAGKLILTK